VRDWPPSLPWWQRRDPDWERLLMLWPTFRHKDDLAAMAAIFDDALSDVFREGGRVVVADEVYFLIKKLGLEDWLSILWTQGRSIGITVVGGTQRPAHVPLFMYDQAVHLFLFSDNDERNLQRVGGLGGLSADLIRAIVAALPHHEVLYVNTRTRELIRTRVAG